MAKAATSRLDRRDAVRRGGRDGRRSVPRSSSTQAEGVLDITDIERVHDMRVATPPPAGGARDLRDVLPGQAAQAGALRDVKALADALGARRDPDVHLPGPRAARAPVPAPDAAGRPRPSRRGLHAEQASGNDVLAAALERGPARPTCGAPARRVRGAPRA